MKKVSSPRFEECDTSAPSVLWGAPHAPLGQQSSGHSLQEGRPSAVPKFSSLGALCSKWPLSRTGASLPSGSLKCASEKSLSPVQKEANHFSETASSGSEDFPLPYLSPQAHFCSGARDQNLTWATRHRQRWLWRERQEKPSLLPPPYTHSHATMCLSETQNKF